MTAELQQDHPNEQLSYISFNPTASIQPDLYTEQVQQLDFFHPFLDPEMLDIFPGGEVMNFAELDTSPMSLNFLDGWAPGMEASFPEAPLQAGKTSGHSMTSHAQMSE